MTLGTRQADHPEIFVAFGMPRTGTTFLYQELQKHPEIYVPYRKESFFFSVNYEKGLPWYLALFEGQKSGQIGADINPMYYHDPAAIQRLLDYDPSAKVILGVRHPVDFAVSLYGNMHAHGVDVPSIAETYAGFDWPLVPERSLHIRLEPGFMQDKIEKLQAAFGKNLLIYDFSYFDDSPVAVLQQIEKFIGLSPYFSEDNTSTVKINASGRRDLFFLNRLIANQNFLNTLYRLLPDYLIRQLRKLYENLSARKSRPASKTVKSLVSAEEVAALESHFSADIEYYEQFFKVNGSVVGSDPIAKE